MKKISYLTACCVCALLSLNASIAYPAQEAEKQKEANPIIRFLKDIEYTSRLKTEYDSNIFLRESDEDSDFKEIFTQSLFYKTEKGDHYFQWGYTGNYLYYDQESVGILSQSANSMYSYRPFDGFSVGIRNDFNWLEDSDISTTFGDQILALGYVQDTPSAQVKYELNPRTTLTTDAYFQVLDVRSPDNDDYIDNRRLGAQQKIEYNFTDGKDLVGFAGFGHRQISFPQISEKSAAFERGFVGLSEKMPALLVLSQEVGFENIYMDDNPNDDHVDFKVSLESIFSLYTKFQFSYSYNTHNPSLRRQYTQYGSNVAAFSLSHLLNPKTSLSFDYSYEQQDFDSQDVTAGQAIADNETKIQHIKGTLSRKLNNWLTGDFIYDYTKRDTDFANESYIDHQFSVAVTAKY